MPKAIQRNAMSKKSGADFRLLSITEKTYRQLKVTLGFDFAFLCKVFAVRFSAMGFSV